MKSTGITLVISGLVSLISTSGYGHIGETREKCSNRYGNAVYSSIEGDLEMRSYSSGEKEVRIVFFRTVSVLELFTSRPLITEMPDKIDHSLAELIDDFKAQLCAEYLFSSAEVAELMPLKRTTEGELSSGTVSRGHLFAGCLIVTKTNKDAVPVIFNGFVGTRIAGTTVEATAAFLDKSTKVENSRRQTKGVASNGNTSSPLQGQSNERSEASSTPGTELRPSIKGLSIGMDFSRIEPWFVERLKKTSLGFEILPEGDNRVFLIAQAGALKYLREDGVKVQASVREEQLRTLRYFEENPSFVQANSDGKVIFIVFRPKLVDYLFQVSDLSVAEFIKTFAEAYKLGEIGVAKGLSPASHTTSEGVKIVIESDKTVIMKKVASPTEIKRAFD